MQYWTQVHCTIQRVFLNKLCGKWNSFGFSQVTPKQHVDSLVSVCYGLLIYGGKYLENTNIYKLTIAKSNRLENKGLNVSKYLLKLPSRSQLKKFLRKIF